LPHLSQQVGDFLRDVQQSDGVAILKGEANALTSGGLEIDSFLLFKAKSPQMVLAAGIDLNEHALAYLPAGVNGVVGLANGVRQNLADVLEAAQNTPNLAEVLVQVKARMQRTGEPFIDALAKLASPSEPMFRGELAANYVRPIIEDPAVKGSKPVFVARGTMPFKVAWDALAQRNRAVPASHAFMPKIGVVPRYSLAEMITQMLTPEEMERRLSGRSFRRLAAAFRALPEPIRTQIESELGHPFAELSGRTRGEIVSALANIGIDERCYQALALFEQLEAEKGKRPQDRDPNIRSRIKGLYAESKGNTQHAVRPLLNLLLGGTNFGRFSRRNSILFMDEAGSTGSTVNSAELIIRAFHDAATWKFYTVQPTKDTTGLYDGDSRIRFKPEENNPKLYDMLFFGTGNGRLHRSLGTRLTYAEAEIELEVKVSAPNLYEESLRVYNENVTAFLRRHYGEIFDGIRRLNSRHAREVLKMILRRREPGLEASIAEIIVKEEMVPNHTKHRYTIRGELGKLEKRIVALLRADQDTRITLSLLDADISTEDSIETLKRWQENFDRHREDIIRGAE